jgi:hypothetical protein
MSWLSRMLDNHDRLHTFVFMYHSFANYDHGIHSPDVIGCLPEIRHIRAIENLLEYQRTWRPSPFLNESMEELFGDPTLLPSGEVVVADWLSKWVDLAQWSSDPAEFPSTFIGRLQCGGVVYAIGRRLIFVFESEVSGTCARVVAPQFVKVLMSLGDERPDNT